MRLPVSGFVAAVGSCLSLVASAHATGVTYDGDISGL